MPVTGRVALPLRERDCPNFVGRNGILSNKKTNIPVIMNSLIKLTALTVFLFFVLVCLHLLKHSLPESEGARWFFIFAHIVVVSGILFVGLNMETRKHPLCFIFGHRWVETKRQKTGSYLLRNLHYSKIEDTCTRCDCVRQSDEIAGIDKKWHARTFYRDIPQGKYTGIKETWWNKPR